MKENRKIGWTWKHYDFDRLCPRISSDTYSHGLDLDLGVIGLGDTISIKPHMYGYVHHKNEWRMELVEERSGLQLANLSSNVFG